MRSFTLVGTFLILGGLACFGSGGAVLYQALDQSTVQKERLDKLNASCKENVFKFTHHFAPKDDGSVRVDFEDVKDPRVALGDATAVLALCPNRRITEACFGAGCGAGGAVGDVKFHVTLSGPLQ